MAGRKPKVSNDDLLRAVALSPDPAVTTSEVAEKVSLSRQGVYERLEKLTDDGLLRSKQVGSKAKVYWITAEGKKQIDRA